MFACCGLGLMGGLMLTILLMKRKQGKSEKERQEELINKAKEGSLTSEEAAYLAANPPYTKDQSIEAEIDRYGSDYKPMVEQLVKEFRMKKIEYIDFITELNVLRNKALKDKQYDI
jgi:hypothetical protein